MRRATTIVVTLALCLASASGPGRARDRDRFRLLDHVGPDPLLVTASRGETLDEMYTGLLDMLGGLLGDIERLAREGGAPHDLPPRSENSGTQSAKPPQRKLRRQGNVRSLYERTQEIRSHSDFFDTLSHVRSFSAGPKSP